MIDVIVALMLSVLALGLSVFNTYVLARAHLITSRDIATILSILDAIVRVTPTTLDDRLLEELEKLVLKYVKKRF